MLSIPQDLLPGDILLYYSNDAVDKVIAWKEGDILKHPVSHVEVYAGNSKSWASRNGIGVGHYDFRSEGLVIIKRPCGNFDSNFASLYFVGVDNCPYGWGDILNNVGIASSTKGYDCSNFASLLLEAGHVPQFDCSIVPHALIQPRDFLISLNSTMIYEAA